MDHSEDTAAGLAQVEVVSSQLGSDCLIGEEEMELWKASLCETLKDRFQGFTGAKDYLRDEDVLFFI